MDIEYTFEQLASLSNARLEEIFRQAKTPDFENLAGYEFRGWNTPAFASLLGIRKFKKGFYHKDGKPFGYNIPVKQNGLGGPWICKPSDDNPRRFGFYRVNEPGSVPISDKEPHALVLDYSGGDNKLFEGSFLRDYLAHPYPENPDIYLGKAYMALGPKLVFSNFFVLERHRESALK